MTFPGPINYYRHCYLPLLLILTYHCHAVIPVTVIGRQPSKERDAKDALATDTRSVKVDNDNDDNEAENKHFMDVYSLQSGPRQLEFGHVFEDPNVWEQRYEKKDFDAERHQGMVKWGDKDGGYGEQYWDLNHGGAEESASDDEKYEPYEETTPSEYVQESRRRTVLYKPMMIMLLRNKPNKKPVRSVRNDPKKLLGPKTTPKTPGTGKQKSAPVLVFDMQTGVVMDEATGNKFILKPINNDR